MGSRDGPGAPLFYGLRYTGRIIATLIPEQLLKNVERGWVAGPALMLMDALFIRALAPDHPSCDTLFTGVARWLLYVRSHYL